jgi:hypothetical protein
VGFHAWPLAPAQTAFLRNQHRHRFFISIDINVSKQFDREIEFFDAQERINKILCELYEGGEVGEKSCETMATEIMTACECEFGALRIRRVEVSEDGENSGIIENS